MIGTMTLGVVASMPEGDLRFRHFRRLRVPGGRDGYSTRGVAQLRQLVGVDAVDCIESETAGPYYASALRWMVRGLPSALAIRRAHVDEEIGACAASARGAA